MEACADSKVPVIVLDRPNPNAHYVDGPMMEEENQSFLGKVPIPLVYGMTIGEYAKMLVGEEWLDSKISRLTGNSRRKLYTSNCLRTSTDPLQTYPMRRR